MYSAAEGALGLALGGSPTTDLCYDSRTILTILLGEAGARANVMAFSPPSAPSGSISTKFARDQARA